MPPQKDDSVTPEARAIADGVKIAIRELATEDSETVKHLLGVIWVIWSDGANRWFGSKLTAAIAAALFAGALWLAGSGWRK